MDTSFNLIVKEATVMKNKSVLICCILLLCLCISSLSSCAFIDLNTKATADTVTREELQAALKDASLSGATVIGGNTYEITVNRSGGDSIIAASKSLLSVASVVCGFEKNVYYWGGGKTTQSYSSAGAGVIFRLDKEHGDAYVLTNYHVVYDASSNTQNHISNSINLYLYGQESSKYAIPASYVGGSMSYDLAVLKISGSAVLAESSAVAATFADSNDVSVLQTAIAVGNPEARGISITVGSVNVDSEYITLTGADERTTVSLRVMRIDAAVNSGNSGGGLFDANGDLIGIVNAKMSSDSVDNIGYAIPSNIAKYIAQNIIDYCDGKDNESVYRCMIGITVAAAESKTVYDEETCKVHKIETVVVDSITEGSISDGNLMVGDVIRSVEIDGTEYEVNRMYNVIDSMLNVRVGSEVVFRVVRGGEEINVPIEITEKALTPQV